MHDVGDKACASIWRYIYNTLLWVATWIAAGFLFWSRRWATVRLRCAATPDKLEAVCRTYLAHRDKVVQRLAIVECERRGFIDMCDALWDVAQDSAACDNRLYALRCLGHFGDQRIVDVCVQLLLDPRVQQRCGAVTALGGIETVRAAGILESVMESDSAPEVRTLAAIALVRLGSDGPVPTLESGLASMKGSMRALVAATLACAGSSIGERTVIDLRDHGNPSERAFLRQCFLCFYHWRRTRDLSDQFMNAWRRFLVQ